MRIALYYPWIYLTSGAERVILELSGSRSRHEWTLFTSHYAPSQTFPEFANRRVVELDRVSVDRSLASVAVAASKLLRLHIPMEEFDALVVVCEGIGDLVVFRNDSHPVLCLCLTPLRLVFDAEYRARTLLGRGPFARLAINAGSRVFRTIDRMAWKRYRRIVFISEEAQRRAVNGRLTEQDRVEVLHVGLGVDAADPSPVFEPFFLIAGRIMWTKNIQLGIEAFRRLLDTSPAAQQFSMVIAGMVDKKSEAYLAELKRLAEGLPIEFRIAPSDAELAGLYSRCYGVLFTPFNEDWGIVPLEAMAFGKPVIAVNSGGPRETVVSGVNGFLEEPCGQAFAKRMVQLVEDPDAARRMGASGHAHSRRYSWSAFTERIDVAIEELGADKACEAHLAQGKHELGRVV
jgi:glycosyltransferase involved in cell wall biosynthesis